MRRAPPRPPARVSHRLAVGSGPVSIGDRTIWHPPLLGLPPLAHGRSLPEVVQLYLPDGRHEAEGLHVDGVHDSLKTCLMRLDHFHESGRGVHPAAQPVGLPADDCVEASLSRICQHPLELRTLLCPAPANLLVARHYDQPPALAVSLHVAYLLGDGGLVLRVLALVRYAGVYGRPFPLCFPLNASRHDCLLSIPFISVETKKTRLLSEAGLRVVQYHRITCSGRWRHGPGCLQHRRANFYLQ